MTGRGQVLVSFEARDNLTLHDVVFRDKMAGSGVDRPRSNWWMSWDWTQAGSRSGCFANGKTMLINKQDTRQRRSTVGDTAPWQMSRSGFHMGQSEFINTSLTFSNPRNLSKSQRVFAKSLHRAWGQIPDPPNKNMYITKCLPGSGINNKKQS